jgi:hypothetical protein
VFTTRDHRATISGPSRTRTGDAYLFRVALYQLSYRTNQGTDGIEVIWPPFWPMHSSPTESTPAEDMGFEPTRLLRHSCFRGSLLTIRISSRCEYAWLLIGALMTQRIPRPSPKEAPTAMSTQRIARDSNPQGCYAAPTFQAGCFPFAYYPDGRSGIRTLGGLTLAGFQGQCIRPLCQPSKRGRTGSHLRPGYAPP